MTQAPTIDAANLDADTPALDWRPVLEIHRGDPDGYVGYGAKKPDGSGLWHVGAVKVREVREMLPGVLAHFIERDGYFCVNPFWRAGAVWRKTGLPYLLRREKMLLELAACYADLDVGRPEEESKHPGAALDWQAAQIEALHRQREGIIPPFSMMAASGRGVYLFWLLRDEREPDKLPRAYPSAIIRYKAVNRALHERLYGLACDAKAVDAVRFLRHPGSIHTKVMRRVTYSLTVQADDGGRLTYSLPELERLLHLDAPAPSLPADVREKARPQLYTREPYRKTKLPGSRPQNRNAYIRTNELRAQDLETVEAWRGGWLHAGHEYPDGFVSPGRGLMLRLYAGWLRGSGKDGGAVLDAVRRMAANCKPPYPSDPGDMRLEQIVADAFSPERRKHVKNVRNIPWTDKDGVEHPGLCDGMVNGKLRRGWLGISEQTDPDLLAKLESILPEPVKALRDAAIPQQADYTAERRRAIAHIVELRHAIPPARKMMALLAADPFNVVNPATREPWSYEIIRQDYDALGYPAARPGRRRKAATSTGGAVIVPDWLKPGAK
jgi:hypothetical protein